MSQPRSPKVGRPLVGLPFLLAMGAVFTGVVVALHPDVLGVRTWIGTDSSDAVSLSYLSLELERRPGARALRVAYVKQLRSAGRSDEAARAAAPLLVEEPLDPEVVALVSQIEIDRVRAVSGDLRRQREEALARLLGQAHSLTLTEEQRSSFVAIALEIQRPDLAAQFMDQAMELDAATRLEKAAVLYSEADRVDDAADRWLSLAELELAGAARPDPLSRAITSLESAARTAEALDLSERWLEKAPRQRDALDAAIRLNLGAGRLDRAFKLSTRRVSEFSEDAIAHEAHVRLALARAEPVDALPAARRLVRLRPGHRASRVLRARVAEWSGSPDEALESWWALALRGDVQARKEAERLARGLGDDRVLLALLSLRLNRGENNLAILEQLVFLSEKIGEPERARQALLRASKKPKAPKRVMIRLARLEARMGLLATASDRWSGIHERYGTTPAEDVERAQLAWRASGPEEALENLTEGGELDQKLASASVADLAANLAWHLGDRATALRAHRALLEIGQLESYQIVRLVRLLRAEGRLFEAMDVVEESLGAVVSPEVLLRGLELAVAARRPQRASALLQASPPSERAARLWPAYWRYRAELARMEGDPAVARTSLERVVQLDPGSTQALADLLWLLLDLDDRDGLSHWFDQAGEGADDRPQLWRVLAVAASRVGRHQEALRWYALEAGRRPEDWSFWLDYAGALEQVGRRNSALRLRKYGLRQVSEQERLGRLLLGQGVLPKAELLLSARLLAFDREASSSARNAAVRFLLSEDDRARSERAIRDGDADDEGSSSRWGTTALSWYEARLSLALAKEDRAAVVRMIQSPPQGLDPSLEAEAYALLGEYDRALHVAFQSRVDGRTSVGRESVLLFLRAESLKRPREVVGAANYLRVGELDAFGAEAGCVLSEGSIRTRLEVAAHALEDRPGRAVGRAIDGDGRLAIEVEHFWDRGLVAFELGGQAQVGGNTVPQFELNIRRALDEQLEVFIRGRAFAVVPETPLLYTLAARDDVSMGMAWRLPERFSLMTSINLEHHHGRQGGTFGFGVVGDARLARDFLWQRGERRLSLYTSARAVLRDAQSRFPRELESLAAAGLRPEDLLPTEFAVVGVGAQLAQGDLTVVPDPDRALRYFVDVWGGWQWPSNEPAYQVEAGLGQRLFGPDELYVRGFFGNVLTGLEGVQAGLQVGYRVRLDP